MSLSLGLGLYLGSRGPLVQIFDPTTVVNMVIRWRVSQAVTSSGATLIDSVPNEGTLGPGGANVNNLAFFGARPTNLPADATFGNRPMAHHATAGVSTALRTGTLSAAITQPSTWYCVGSAGVSVDTVYANFRLGNAGSTSNTHALGVQRSTNTVRVAAGTTIMVGSAALNTKHVSCTVYDGASTTLYVNDPATGILTGNANTNTATSILVGYIGAAPPAPDMKWGEQIGYLGAHDQATRTSIMSYFAAVYGL